MTQRCSPWPGIPDCLTSDRHDTDGTRVMLDGWTNPNADAPVANCTTRRPAPHTQHRPETICVVSVLAREHGLCHVRLPEITQALGVLIITG